MANNNETIADIVANMREKSAEYDRLCREHQDFKEQILLRDWWHNNVVTFRTIADRLEAAYKRERAKIEADALDVGGILGAAHRRELSKNMSKNGADFGQLGDTAKLREALAPFPPLCEWLVENAAKLGIGDMVPRLRERCDNARAALSAPARNCEKYTTVDEAMYDYADEALIEEWNALKAGKDRDMLAEELFVFTKWLFAPATEKEGGKDAD